MPNHESEWWCICVIGLLILSLFLLFIYRMLELSCQCGVFLFLILFIRLDETQSQTINLFKLVDSNFRGFRENCNFVDRYIRESTAVISKYKCIYGDKYSLNYQFRDFTPSTKSTKNGTILMNWKTHNLLVYYDHFSLGLARSTILEEVQFQSLHLPRNRRNGKPKTHYC